MQPGCHNVQEIAINRAAKHAENNWSLCVLAAGAVLTGIAASVADGDADDLRTQIEAGNRPPSDAEPV